MQNRKFPKKLTPIERNNRKIKKNENEAELRKQIFEYNKKNPKDKIIYVPPK